MLTVLLIGVLVAHGIAHPPGFLVPWQRTLSSAAVKG